MKRTTRTLTMALMLIVGLQLFAGCSSEDAVTAPADPVAPAGAPELPPMSTMKVDLNFFGIDTPQLDEGTLAKSSPNDYLQATPAGERSHFINAFVRAIYVQLLMYDALEEPIGAFAIAIHSIPQDVGDGSYLWTYIFVEDGVEYSIFLYGTPLADRVLWRLEVSTNAPGFLLDHFVWFDGEAMKDDSQGYWQFYEPVFAPAVAAAPAATDGTELMRIDWQNLSNVEHRLTISVNAEGHEDEGDYVEFYESAAMGSINFYDASEQLLSDITWFANGSGSLTVPDYNDGLQACWDTEQINTDCP